MPPRKVKATFPKKPVKKKPTKKGIIPWAEKQLTLPFSEK